MPRHLPFHTWHHGVNGRRGANECTLMALAFVGLTIRLHSSPTMRWWRLIHIEVIVMSTVLERWPDPNPSSPRRAVKRQTVFNRQFQFIVDKIGRASVISDVSPLAMNCSFEALKEKLGTIFISYMRTRDNSSSLYGCEISCGSDVTEEVTVNIVCMEVKQLSRWWDQKIAKIKRYQELDLKEAELSCPKELQLPRKTKHALQTAPCSHGDFEIYNR